MKELLLDRKRVKCYETGEQQCIGHTTIELYANTSNYGSGEALYYIDLDVDLGSVYKLGVFETYEAAVEAFNTYCEAERDLLSDMED